MHPKYYCLEKSGAHSKLFLYFFQWLHWWPANVESAQEFSRLWSYQRLSSTSSLLSLLSQELSSSSPWLSSLPHHMIERRHHHHLETLILSTPPLNTISIIFTKFSKECNTLLYQSQFWTCWLKEKSKKDLFTQSRNVKPNEKNTGPFLLCSTNYWCQEMFYEGNKCFSFSTQYLWNWVVGVDKTTTTKKIKGIIIFFW